MWVHVFKLEKDFMKIGNIEGDFMEFGKDEKKSFVQLEPKPNPALAHPTPPPPPPHHHKLFQFFHAH